MPFSRGKNPSSIKVPGKGSIGVMENQEGVHSKRSSPQGGVKKRSAFVDITNATKIQINNQTKIGKPAKEALRSKEAAKNEANLKEPKAVCSNGQSMKLEVGLSPKKDLVVWPQEKTTLCPGRQVVPDEFDIDKEFYGDVSMSAEYAKEIFDYLREREEKFVLKDYMNSQPDLNKDMRGILVDWMVELQENFELNHETLYLAVKLTDHYLACSVIMRESLQLIGSTAMLIASKFEERTPPCIDDFLYICDDAYKREEIIAMEINILQALQFDINIPVPYRFLRRYAKCVSASMETLTLARYVCELSLLELQQVPERGSRLAAACLLLALITKGLGGWTSMLEYHTGYTVKELTPLVKTLRTMLACPTDDKLTAVTTKYSHKVFFEVACIPLVAVQTLEDALIEQQVS
ncbi:G2/mitotic-specific cyclin-B3-like [Salvelinus alpinus]|uniref:G2/mitotic-specific cyclin-B3-like n=1 Tax=Salvelinus alpinus TaxID=8036 RepID=UPI0039FC13B5